MILALLLSTSSAVSAQNLDPTVLGAITDSPAREIEIGGNTVKIFEAARNPLSQSSDLHSAHYFYFAKPSVALDSQGAPRVTINQSILDPSKVYAQVDIRPSQINKNELLQAMREAVDPYLTASRLTPLMVYGVDFTIQGLPTITTSYANAENIDNAASPSWELNAEQADRLRAALSNNTPIRFGYTSLVKLSTVNSLKLDWSSVVKTRTFLDYTGPSGPSYISVSQASDFATGVLNDLKILDWRESNQGGYSDQVIEEFSKSILDKFLTSKARKEVGLLDFIKDQNRDLPLDEWQRMVDVTTSIAVDAKSLDDNQWCRKYRNQLKTLAETGGSGGRSRGFGFSVPIPKLGKLGFNYGSSSSSNKTSLNTYDSVAESQDCGRSQVSDSFKYEWSGTKYVPKSIYAFERNTGAASLTDRQIIERRETTQRLGRNEWILP